MALTYPVIPAQAAIPVPPSQRGDHRGALPSCRRSLDSLRTAIIYMVLYQEPIGRPTLRVVN